MVEQFVVSMYDRTCPHSRVNECRQYLFTHLGRVIDNCPPTQDALIQHIKRAMLQSRIWASCLSLTEPHVDITEWGWNINAAGEVNPLWTTLPKASQACKELKNCKCKDVNTSCTCKSYALPCTELCLCRGYCEWISMQKEHAEQLRLFINICIGTQFYITAILRFYYGWINQLISCFIIYGLGHYRREL